MQRITNLLAIKDGQVLLLQKPRRGRVCGTRWENGARRIHL